MANDVIRLEIAVDDKGSPVIKTVTDKIEDLGKKAGTASAGQLKLNQAAAEARGIFENLGREGASLLGRFGNLVTLLGPLGLGMGAVSLGASKAVAEFSRFAVQVRDLSYLSGGSARDVSMLITAMEDLGVEAGTVEQGINRMSQAVSNGDPTVLKLVGSFRTQSGALKDGLTLYYETIDALGGMTNEVERNRAAQEIFGRGWTAMVPAIQQGSRSIKQMGEENAALGKVVNEQGIRAVEDLRMAMNNLKGIAEGLGVALGSGIIGTLVKVTSTFEKATARALEYRAAMKMLTASGVRDPQAIENVVGMSGDFSDVGAWRRGKPAADGSVTIAPPTPFEEEQLRKLAEIRAKNEYESLKAQQAILDEATALGAKYLQDEAKREDEATDVRVKNYYESLKAQQAMLDEAEEFGKKYLEDEAKRVQDAADAETKIREQQAADDIKSWVRRIEEQEALDERAAKDEAQRLQDAARQREEAWRTSFFNMRGITEDAFAGVNTALSTSVKGVMQGTQEMEDLFAHMGENIALGLVDSIVNRGLKAVESALLDFAFGNSGGGAGSGMLSGILGGLGSLLSGAGSSIYDVGSSVASGIGTFLGSFATGLWNVPDRPGHEIAILHPGEMVLPPDVAAQARAAGSVYGWDGAAAGMSYGSDAYATALEGGNSGLAQILLALSRAGVGIGGATGGGVGGTGAAPGAYGSLSAAERSALESIMSGAKRGALGLGLLGVPSPLGPLSGMIRGVLGIDALMSMFGITPSLGYYGLTEQDFQGIRDTYGYGSVQEAAARLGNAIAQSIDPDVRNALANQAAAEGWGNIGGYGSPMGDWGEPGNYGGWGGSEGPGGTSGGATAGDNPGGPGADDGSGNSLASGALFNTRGKTRMTVGEAGTETVAVLRNPRTVDAAGGAPVVHVNINIENRGVLGDHLPTNIARTIKDSLDRLWKRELRPGLDRRSR